MPGKASLVVAFSVTLCSRAAAGDASSYPTADDFAADRNTVTFAVPGEFWRPVRDAPPDVTLSIERHAIIASSPCFSYGSHFHTVGGKAVFDLQFSTSASTTAQCAPGRAAFEAFESRLHGTASFRRTEDGIVLQAANGGDIVALAPVPPDGFEFRPLTVASFRYAGKLRPLKQLGKVAYLIFHSGQVDGTVGCGSLFMSSYRGLGSARFDFNLTWLYDLACSNDKPSEAQAERIALAFTGVRDVAALPMDEFELRDAQGNVQLILSPVKGDAP